eukprot:Nk52_evm9s169 gene=Nk52_evmTU9s169
MSDSKYFSTTKKGEIYELKAELNADKKHLRKEAVKKVIASMTVGKDVSSLFPDVVNCMQTDNLELKKLVYLYLMNYAKSNPDMAIMAVNTFVRDCSDPNPLIRALAIRTMGCIRVDKITEYVCEPLRKCLCDEDPYVRKTAAVCVAKLYDINAHLVEEEGFLDMLRDLLSDANPMVVANAVAALSELNEANGNDEIFAVNTATLNKLLTALNECTEWGQIFILDSLAQFTPEDSQRAIGICERVSPRLQHANAAVVLSAVKVVMKYMEIIDDPDVIQSFTRKLSPPLVTLLSSEPEVQYVALRNINLIVQKRPAILKHELKVFFVKYNDPIYVKLEKLDIMIRLTSEQNITQVLAELREYATEVDVDFVRKAVRAIGRCAIKIEQASERCIDTLLDLIHTKVNYVVQEAIVVIKDIFRKYPNRYESIIAKLCDNLDTLDEPEAKASMIWIIGEYAERIDNADELLDSFFESFQDETIQVQLQLLTAIVKLFLKRPAGSQDLVQKVLTLATQESDNPDLRDRGYIYWRLLSTDPAAAKAVVLSEKPLIADETDVLEPSLLDELICHISTLASVYHKPPSAFVIGKTPGRVHLPARVASQNSMGSGDDLSNSRGRSSHQQQQQQQPNDLLGDLLDLDIGGGGDNMNAYGGQPQQASFGNNNMMGGGAPAAAAAPSGAGLGGGLDDLLGMGGMGGGTSAAAPAPTAQPGSGGGAGMGGGLDDLLGGGGFGMGGAGAAAPSSGMNSQDGGFTGAYSAPPQEWLSAEKGKGCEVQGTFSRRDGAAYMDLVITNRGMQPVTGFAMQFNRNSFGLAPDGGMNVPEPLQPNQTARISQRLSTTGGVQKANPINMLQIAVKNSVDIFYFSTMVPLHVLLMEETHGLMERQQYLQMWKEIPDENERQTGPFPLHAGHRSVESVEGRLKHNNIFTVAKRHVEGQDLLYLSVRFCNGIWVLLELTIIGGGQSAQLAVKTRAMDVESGLSSIVKDILA